MIRKTLNIKFLMHSIKGTSGKKIPFTRTALQEIPFDLGHQEMRQLGQGVHRNSLTTDSFNMGILNTDSFKKKAITGHLKQGQLEQTGTFLTKKQLQV
jgi:hypothetical protein